MKRFFAFFLILILVAPGALAGFSDIRLEVKQGESISICARQTYVLEVLTDEGGLVSDLKWSTSDEDIIWILPDGSIMGVGLGSATLTGKAKEGTSGNVKIRVTVPKVYTSDDSIIVDTPEGIEFGYAFNTSGYMSVSMKGECFTTKPLDDVGEIEMFKILPVKVGSGSIVFSANGKTVKTVKIEVKKSAFEPTATTSPVPQTPTPQIEVVDTPLPSVQIDKDVEAKLDQYIAEFGLTEECKEVIVQYLPNVNDFDMLVQAGYQGYDIIMNDGTVYYLTVLKDKTPACLQSSEKDYKSRIRYYDKFAK